MPGKAPEAGRKVFISYSRDDTLPANQVSAVLRDAGFEVWSDERDLPEGQVMLSSIEDAVHASDVLLVLLSKDSVASDWVRFEMSGAFTDRLRARAVSVLPALLEDCEMPDSLVGLPVLDLRSNLDDELAQLVEQLTVSSAIDFSRLDGRTFEALIGDLLNEMGFEIDQGARTPQGHQLDFVATRATSDPFSLRSSEVWAVEVKLYRSERVGVAALREAIGIAGSLPPESGLLLVTNGQLTSVATRYISESLAGLGRDFRLVDGALLRSLLTRYPGLVTAYFSQRAAE